VAEGAELEAGHALVDPAGSLRGAERVEAEGHVGGDVEVGEEGAVLRDEAHVPALRRHPGGRVEPGAAPPGDDARGGAVEAREAAQEGALACARRAEEHRDGEGPGVEGELGRAARTVGGAQLDAGDQVVGHRKAPSRCAW
jgi:hypothetical protein